MASADGPELPLTLGEFVQRSGVGQSREELVEGRVVTLTPPGTRHGSICGEVVWLLNQVAKPGRLGTVVCNDSGVITSRDPDTLRGADVAFYSFDRLPLDRITSGYPEVPPNLVIEVRSPSERWGDLLRKVGEYLGVGVSTVVVLDDESRSAQVFDADHPVRLLGPDDEVTLPTMLPGFRVTVRGLFEQ